VVGLRLFIKGLNLLGNSRGSLVDMTVLGEYLIADTYEAHVRLRGGRCTSDMYNDIALQGANHRFRIVHHFSSNQTETGR
jgi:hypothetical protein